MRRVVAGLGVLVALAVACRAPRPPQGYWKPGATDQEFARDYRACTSPEPTQHCVGGTCQQVAVAMPCIRRKRPDILEPVATPTASMVLTERRVYDAISN
jgi:hypothetical protein